MGIDILKGAIFDLDGVITQTAITHFKAWKFIFEEYLYQRAKIYPETTIYSPFNKEDYLTYVDGKPRYEGVMSFLESRGIELPYGSVSDDVDKRTICGLGNRKNQKFRELVEDEGVKIYESSIDFIDALKAQGVQVSVASSSKNSRYIIEKCGLLDKFESIVGGIEAEEKHLRGKPEPDIFITAAEEMGLHPTECLMVEDAISGVQAGKKGNFSCVIAVARNDNRFDLLRYGGDFIVNDLKEIGWKDLERWYEEDIYKDLWHLRYHGFAQSEEKLRETLTTVGNGYFASRGCLESEPSYKDIHYPGTYIAGLYNKLATEVHDRKIYNNDFVNIPNWLRIDLKIGEGTYLDILKTKILSYFHELDMKNALMRRRIKFEDDQGRITTLESERFASMDNPHLGMIRYTITPHNYYETITIRSFLDGTVINDGVPRYRALNAKHLNAKAQEVRSGKLFLHVQTTESKVDIYMHARHLLYKNGKQFETEGKVVQTTESVEQTYSFDIRQNQPVSLEKTISLTTSKADDVKDPENEGFAMIRQAGNFREEFEHHRKRWHRLWDIADFKIEGDRFVQKAIRLHIYHLLVTSSPHNKHIDAGIPARGLHGEAYRGHIFWDELYILPFFNLHFPEISKADLMYRYRRLDAAREEAKAAGYKGAMYPWQTANDGYEETQTIHYNPVSGKWDPDLSLRQRHVSLAIAVNILNYSRSTSDRDFMHQYGGEMLFEITRFWASIAEKDKKDKKYHIKYVMGPDEFHEKYPGAKEGGIHDNAYTNVMVSWLMNKMIRLYNKFDPEELKDIKEKTGINDEEIHKWEDIRDNLYLEFNKDGVLAQFSGYFKLKELDWERYREKYKNIRRMDRILKAEGDSPDNYKVTKQADTLMLFYTLSPQQIKKTIEQMGYPIDDARKFMQKNYNYYINRTSHGSTLSYVVHASILKYLHTNKTERQAWFIKALESDIKDTQGGTTKEGIHTGVMAGTIDIIVESFAGIELFDDYFEINPVFPDHWREVTFKIHHIKRTFEFEFKFTHDKLKITALTDFENPFSIKYKGSDYQIKPYDTITIHLNKNNPEK
ncbi:MAG: beta-phosphoglucomutase family hydrolase [Bacteroidales bacterium]